MTKKREALLKAFYPTLVNQTALLPRGLMPNSRYKQFEAPNLAVPSSKTIQDYNAPFLNNTTFIVFKTILKSRIKDQFLT